MSKAKIAVLATLLGCGLGTMGALTKVREINKQLGTDMLEQQLAALKKEFQQENKQFNSENKLLFTLQNVDNELNIFFKRWTCYAQRLLHYGSYQNLCKEVNETVIKPVVRNYETAGIFEHSEVIPLLLQEGNFNNKLTFQIMKVQQTNLKIKQYGNPQVQELDDLQNKLITTTFVGLKQQSKGRIDLLYKYLQARDKSLSRNSNEIEQLNPEQQKWRESDYLYKLQFL